MDLTQEQRNAICALMDAQSKIRETRLIVMEESIKNEPLRENDREFVRAILAPEIEILDTLTTVYPKFGWETMRNESIRSVDGFFKGLEDGK